MPARVCEHFRSEWRQKRFANEFHKSAEGGAGGQGQMEKVSFCKLWETVSTLQAELRPNTTLDFTASSSSERL